MTSDVSVDRAKATADRAEAFLRSLPPSEDVGHLLCLLCGDSLIPIRLPMYFMDSELRKQMLCMLVIPVLCTHFRPEGACLCTEAWMATYGRDLEDAVDQPRPSERPDRREVVMLCSYGPGLGPVRTLPIERDADERILLGEAEETLHGISSRFTPGVEASLTLTAQGHPCVDGSISTAVAALRKRGGVYEFDPTEFLMGCLPIIAQEQSKRLSQLYHEIGRRETEAESAKQGGEETCAGV